MYLVWQQQRPRRNPSTYVNNHLPPPLAPLLPAPDRILGPSKVKTCLVCLKCPFTRVLPKYVSVYIGLKVL